MKAQIFPIPIFFVMITVSTNAQAQDRVYPIPELTDEMRGRIDLNDGSVEDWLEVLGEPTLTPLDLFTLPLGSEYDPSSFDFRVWLAWHHGVRPLGSGNPEGGSESSGGHRCQQRLMGPNQGQPFGIAAPYPVNAPETG